MKQRTLRRDATLEGIGLHTGAKVRMTLRPAEADSGVRFRRTDLPGAPVIPARVEHVVQTDRCTTIGGDGARVHTIEHVMSALRGLEIDNVLIDIDGPEVPIPDGSAAEFVRLLDGAGVVEQEAARRVLAVDRPLWVRSGSKLAVALPYDGFKVSFTFTNDKSHPTLGDLFGEFELAPDGYRREIASARTIGWLSEVEALKERGLALGATMDVAVVLGETEVLTPLRFPNEPVRHKILDAIGDLYLAGFIHGHIVMIRSGHELNHKLALTLKEIDAALELSES